MNKDFFNKLLRLSDEQEKNFSLKFPTGYEMSVNNLMAEDKDKYSIYVNQNPNSNTFVKVGDVIDIDLFRKVFKA